MIKYDTRQAIVAQSLNEIAFARDYKQGKVKNWKVNEDLYYGRIKKDTGNSARANVDLGEMAGNLHTTLSKIDNPLTFKFEKRKASQLQRVRLLNALKNIDAKEDDWDIKDIAGKKQSLLYGRAIYAYYADSEKRYKAHLDNIDVYDFLIDPSGGGIDIDKAMYLGDYGVVKTRQDLKDGVKAGNYLKTETQYLLDGSGNSTERPQEEINKQNRTQDQNVWKVEKEIGDIDKYKFWRWFTTYEGERYYLLLSEKGGTAVEVSPLTEKFASGLWPYWTWANYMDLTEFWTPSQADYDREVIMAKATSINQMLDNAEQINKPQKVVNVGAIENLAELKYRRDGYIKVKGSFDVDRAIQTLKVPSISTPIEVYKLLDGINEKSSGVTSASKGVSEEDKVGIYEGNQAEVADRFGLLNKSYAFGYKRFAKLYECGVREHLVKKVAIDILGPDGVEVKEVSRRDLFRAGDEYKVTVEASNAELALSEAEKRQKIAFLSAQAAIPTMPGAKPVQNQQKAYEIQATIAGFDEETIRQLQDATEFGDADLMSEAERDIERILDDEKVSPNQAANVAYKQRFVDFMRNQQENIDERQFRALVDYTLLLDPIITRNMVRQANETLSRQPLPPMDPNAPIDPNTLSGSGPVDPLSNQTAI